MHTAEVVKLEESDFIELLTSASELSIEKALSVVGGEVKTYERIVRLSVKLLPENIERLCGLIDTDLHNYSIEVHGVKGVLNNIGAYNLGETAYELELLSKQGEYEVCRELHPKLIENLKSFHAKMTRVLDDGDAQSKTQGDLTQLKTELDRLSEAAENFDTIVCLDILSALSRQTYGDSLDNALSALAQAFEVFDFEGTETLIEQLKSELY